MLYRLRHKRTKRMNLPFNLNRNIFSVQLCIHPIKNQISDRPTRNLQKEKQTTEGKKKVNWIQLKHLLLLGHLKQFLPILSQSSVSKICYPLKWNTSRYSLTSVFKPVLMWASVLLKPAVYRERSAAFNLNCSTLRYPISAQLYMEVKRWATRKSLFLPVISAVAGSQPRLHFRLYWGRLENTQTSFFHPRDTASVGVDPESFLITFS